MKTLISTMLLFGFLKSENSPYVVVLGIAQDGGLPHAGCVQKCCKKSWSTGENEKVSSIGIIDPKTGQSWLIDATPDFASQLNILENVHNTKLSGIFLNSCSHRPLYRSLTARQRGYGSKKHACLCYAKDANIS